LKLRPAVVAGAALAVVTTIPYLVAWRNPPAPGARFTGAFFYQDDYYQYLSFAEQARRGAVVFANKFDVRPQRPAVVNVEWWLGGAFATLVGSLPVGFHLLRLAAIAALVAAAARLLRRGGLQGARLAGGLALFAFAGGLGWLRLWLGVPGWQVPDILLGVYPFHQSLMNTHFVVGTALLLWTVAFYLDDRAGGGRPWRWIASGWALGLSRPYELVVFVLFCGALLVMDFARGRATWRGAFHGGLRVLSVVPVLLYYAALMLGPAGVEGWTGVRSGDLTPPLTEFALAVAPAAALVALGWRKAAEESRPTRDALATLALVVALIVWGYPSPMAKQFSTMLGPSLLLLAALVAPARWVAPAIVALAPTSVFLMWRVLHPYPDWFAPRDEMSAVGHLGDACRPGDVAIAPTDLSLRIAGLTPCSVALGHRCLTPDWPSAVEAGRRFYDPATAPGWRAEYVRVVRARFVLLPPGADGWLPEGTMLKRLRFPTFEVWEVTDAEPQNFGG
jgi:hypothetical protein